MNSMRMNSLVDQLRKREMGPVRRVMAAMTGAQDSLATGEQLMEMLKGLGVKDLHMFEPLPKHHAQNVETLSKAINHQGLSVIVSRRACIHIKPQAKPLPQCKT